MLHPRSLWRWEKLREKRVPHPLLLVAMTGFGQHQDQRRTVEAGFDQHFTKPVDLEALQSLLTQHGRAAGRQRHACEDR